MFMAKLLDMALSDALCAALQIINHLQDCAPDYRNLDGSMSPPMPWRLPGRGSGAGEPSASPGFAGLLARSCRAHGRVAGAEQGIARDRDRRASWPWRSPSFRRWPDASPRSCRCAIRCASVLHTGQAGHESAQPGVGVMHGLLDRFPPRARPAHRAALPANPALVDDVPAARRTTRREARFTSPADPAGVRNARMFPNLPFCRESMISRIRTPACPAAATACVLCALTSTLFTLDNPPHLRDLARCAAAFSLAQEDFLDSSREWKWTRRKTFAHPSSIDSMCTAIAWLARSAVYPFKYSAWIAPKAWPLANHLGRALQLTKSCAISTRMQAWAVSTAA